MSTASETSMPGTVGGINPATEPFDPSRLMDRYPVYLDLLGDRIVPDDSIDAIAVPAARSAEHIRKAARLATLTTSKLVVLCSHEAKGPEVAQELDDMNLPQPWWVIDVPDGYTIPHLNLLSTEFIPEATRRTDPSNLSDKRNTAMILGKMLGWRKLLHIDDDIELEPSSLRKASLLLPGYQIAGFRCEGFPDKSVVNHAEDYVRILHTSARFRGPMLRAGHISGNSILVNPQTSGVFFPPEIYDEDLFAFYDHYLKRTGALVNSGYHQAKYDPFANPDRARTEEFGEILTDGLYEPMRTGTDADMRSPAYWRGVADTRKSLIEYLLKGAVAPTDRRYLNYMTEPRVLTTEERDRIMRPLQAALTANESITGKMCVDYYNAWRHDTKRWQDHLFALPDEDAVETVLGMLGLHSYVTRG